MKEIKWSDLPNYIGKTVVFENKELNRKQIYVADGCNLKFGANRNVDVFYDPSHPAEGIRIFENDKS